MSTSAARLASRLAPALLRTRTVAVSRLAATTRRFSTPSTPSSSTSPSNPDALPTPVPTDQLPRRALSRAADDVLVPDFAGVADPAFSPNEAVETKRARLMYMARKRGILESDLLMGTFASKYLKGMEVEQLDEFDGLLKENDWDLYYWATGAREVPQDIQELSIWPTMVEHAKNKGRKILRMPDLAEGKSDLDRRAERGKE